MSTIDKKFIQCPTKALFNTKLRNNEFNSQSIVFIKDTGEIWTHGTFFGGLFTLTDTNYGKLNIGGTVTNLSLYGHKHTYTELSKYNRMSLNDLKIVFEQRYLNFDYYLNPK